MKPKHVNTGMNSINYTGSALHTGTVVRIIVPAPEITELIKTGRI